MPSPPKVGTNMSTSGWLERRTLDLNDFFPFMFALKHAQYLEVMGIVMQN